MIVLKEAFNSNVFDGKQLHQKVHGVKATVAAGAEAVLCFKVPYDLCYLTGAEIITDVTSTVNLSANIPDGLGGSTVHEQYGYDVNVGQVYTRDSGYAAQIPLGIQLECTVTNTSAVSKEMGVNFIIHDAREPEPEPEN